MRAKRIRCLGLAIAFLGCTASGAAEPAAAYDIKTPGAHNPCFDREGLWPVDVKKTAYYQQKWEPARLLVWVSKKEGNLKPADLKDLANWQEYPSLAAGGYGDARAATAPPDKETDVVFPDSPRNEYGRRTVIQAPLSSRHVTIGKNVWYDQWHHPPTAGNLWVDGTWLAPDMRFVGEKNTFARFRGERFITKTLAGNKQASASVEFLGRIQCDDWLELNTGTMIAGPGCTLAMGNRHQNIIALRGTLVLMSGATFTTHQAKPFAYDLDVFGKILAGTPDRPLTADAVFLLNAKPKNKQVHPACSPRDRSLKLQPVASITVTSADPAKARLVFRARDKGGLIDLQLSGTSVLDGVLFESAAPGGIQLRDAAVRQSWKNVFFDDRNAEKPDDLFAYNAGTTVGEIGNDYRAAQEQMKQLADEAKAKKTEGEEAEPKQPAPK